MSTTKFTIGPTPKKIGSLDFVKSVSRRGDGGNLTSPLSVYFIDLTLCLEMID
jgi:hypothetical protein